MNNNIGTVYILVSNCGTMFKVGKSENFFSRLEQLEKDWDFDILKSYLIITETQYISKLEVALHKLLITFNVSMNYNKTGVTEFFEIKSLDFLLKQIELIKGNNVYPKFDYVCLGDTEFGKKHEKKEKRISDKNKKIGRPKTKDNDTYKVVGYIDSEDYEKITEIIEQQRRDTVSCYIRRLIREDIKKEEANKQNKFAHLFLKIEKAI